MKRALAGVAALAMAMLLAAPSFAASPSEALRVDRVDVAKYPAVRATVTVPAALGSDDLPAEAFSVDEDGRSRPISVTRVPGDELELVLLMDTSGSMRDALDDAKAAATEFVSQLPDDTRVAVLGFSRRPYVVQRFTEDKAALVAAVDSLRVRGSTALYDGVAEALAQFEESSAQPSIVLLSDGADSSSSLSMRRLERRLQRDSVTLHAIELRSGKANRAALGQLTDAAGGQLVSAGDAQALEGVYSEIGDQLVNQYVVEYQSMAHGRTSLELAVGHHGERAVAKTVVDLPAAPPSLRVLSVDAKDHPEVQVRVVAPRELAERELRDGAFTIMEGAEARDVRVTKVAPADLEVVLAVDTSGSMRGEPLEAVKEAALRFIGALPLEARIAIVAFAEEPAVVFPFSTDRAGARAAVGGLEAGAETALYDAAVAVSRLFDARPTAARSVVLLSDGGDTVSVATNGEAGDALAKHGVTVHAVQLETAETDAETLQRLTRQTGGEVIQARDATALREAYDAVAESVSNQYVLRYRSDAYGGADLVVRVEEGSVRAEAVATAILPPLPRAKVLLGSRAGLIVGAALCYVAMALLLLNVVVPRQRRSVITGSAAARRDRHTGLAELAHRATQLADETLQARGYGSKLNAALEKAGVNLRPGEFIVLAASASVTAGALGLLMGGSGLGLALAALVAFATRGVLSLRAGRRQAKFADQLGDTLQLLAGSLRAGYGLLQAIDSVAREAEQPSADEFRRLLVECRLGRDFSDALAAMATRIGNQDFEWVIQAMEINREVGGDLANVLDTVAGTIRERNQIRGQVKALSAEGRLSAYVLMALPFGIAFMTSMTNPGYLGELTRGGALGYTLIGIAGFLMVVGALWLRKITRLVY